jgi:hypothetical protein
MLIKARRAVRDGPLVLWCKVEDPTEVAVLACLSDQLQNGQVVFRCNPYW